MHPVVTSKDPEAAKNEQWSVKCMLSQKGALYIYVMHYIKQLRHHLY